MVDRYGNVLGAFFDRKMHHIVFSAWRMLVSQIRDKLQKRCRSTIAVIDKWMCKSSEREICAWAFAEWIAICTPEEALLHPPESFLITLGAEDEAPHALEDGVRCDQRTTYLHASLTVSEGIFPPHGLNRAPDLVGRSPRPIPYEPLMSLSTTSIGGPAEVSMNMVADVVSLASRFIFDLSWTVPRRRLRQIVRKWAATTFKHRQLIRQVMRLLMCNDGKASCNFATYFKAWWQRTRHVISFKTRNQLRLHQDSLNLHFSRWYRWSRMQEQTDEFNLELQHRRLSRVHEIWKSRMHRFRQERIISTAYGRIREGMLIRSYFRTWYCNYHLALHLRQGFHDQVLSMSTLFLSDVRTTKLQSQISHLKGRARAMRVCEIFGIEMTMSLDRKTMRDSFESWCMFCNWITSSREFCHRVSNLSNSSLVKKSLFTWANIVERDRRIADEIARILRRWKRSLKWQVLTAWVLCARMRSEARHKTSSFRWRANRRFVRTLLINWKTLSDFEDFLAQISQVMDLKLMRRVCAGWHEILVKKVVRCKQVLRATMLIRRSALKAVMSKWQGRALTQLARNQAVKQTLYTVMKGKLWVITLSWRNLTRIVACGKSKAEWLLAQHSGSIKHRSFWTWTQFCRTCRESESLVVQAQGRRTAKMAHEALERTTLLEWLYRQQFKALYRARMERAAALVLRKRLRGVLLRWEYAAESRHALCRTIIGMVVKCNRRTLLSHIISWSDLVSKTFLMCKRQKNFEKRSLKARTIAFLQWKLTTKTRRLETARLQSAAILVFKRSMKLLLYMWKDAASFSKVGGKIRQQLAMRRGLKAVHVFFTCWSTTAQARFTEKRQYRRAVFMMFRRTMVNMMTIWKQMTFQRAKHERIMRDFVHRCWGNVLYTTLIAWKEYTEEAKMMRMKTERGTRIFFRRLLKEKWLFWRNSAHVSKVSRGTLVHLSSKLHGIATSFAFSYWTKYVRGTSRLKTKKRATCWMNLLDFGGKHSHHLAVRSLRLWKEGLGKSKLFLENHFARTLIMNTIGTVKASFSAWNRLVHWNKQTQVLKMRIVNKSTRQLMKNTFARWIDAVDEFEQECYDLSRWDEWSGPVPEWYAESMTAVIQQRMSTASNFFGSWKQMIQHFHWMVTRCNQRRHDIILRRTLARWQNLQDFRRNFQMDSLSKENCIMNRSNLYLQRDAMRVWSAYVRKYSALRMVSTIICCPIFEISS